jgi:hypothetical protein
MAFCELTGHGPGKKCRKSEDDMKFMHRRRLKVIKGVNPGDTLQYGVNYGIYRSITKDLHADGAVNWHLYDGKKVKVHRYPGDGLFRTDLE